MGARDERGEPLIGGDPVVDFVNTVSWRLDPQRFVDRLHDAPTLVAWAEGAELIDSETAGAMRADIASHPRRAASALTEARRVREAVHGILDAAALGRGPARADLDVLHRASVAARNHVGYAPTLPLRREYVLRTPADLVRLLTLRAEDLLAGGAVERIRQCEGPGCGWFFVDRSRSHSRRWCSSADCGNRDRARRHYARARSSR